jgi:pimeloyl-ACP methyl ester carboxylesterase
MNRRHPLLSAATRAPGRPGRSDTGPQPANPLVRGGLCVVLLLFGLVSAGRVVAQQPDAGLRFAPVPGGRLAYEDRGQGEPVLLIHGAIVADLLRPLAAELATSGYRVIRVHRRGYGSSSPVGDTWSVGQDAADAAALLRYLSIARAHIVSHSAGGIVALECAATFPAMVQTLTLMDPPLAFVQPQQLSPRTGGADAVEKFFLAKGAPDLRSRLDGELPGALQQARKDERRFNAVEWPALGAWSFDESRAHQVTAPVLFISQQRGATVETAQRWWPTMEFVELQGTTHMFPFERPVETARAIAPFLARHSM